MPNLNVPLPQDLYTQMKIYKAKMGPSITWQQYFWVTSQDPEGDVDLEILGVEVKIAEHMFRFSPRDLTFTPVSGYKWKHAFPGVTIPNPQLQSVTTQLGDFIYKYDPQDPNKFKLIRTIRRRMAKRPQNNR